MRDLGRDGEGLPTQDTCVLAAVRAITAEAFPYSGGVMILGLVGAASAVVDALATLWAAGLHRLGVGTTVALDAWAMTFRLALLA